MVPSRNILVRDIHPPLPPPPHRRRRSRRRCHCDYYVESKKDIQFFRMSRLSSVTGRPIQFQSAQSEQTDAKFIISVANNGHLCRILFHV